MIKVDTSFFNEFLNQGKLLLNEPMKNHTSFKIGGNTDFMLLPQTKDDILNAISLCNKNSYPYFVMGNGTNLLVSDKGFKGLIIKICKNYSGATIENNIITAKSGTLLSELSGFALSHSLTGLEFASGIPGTVGGAVFMNAGAYDGEIKNTCIGATILTKEGTIRSIDSSGLEFGYRCSSLQKSESIILSACFKLESGIELDIKEKMNSFNKQRREKQPLTMPSAGSAFKRPEGHFAGKLIMDCGLRGYSIGDAAVSEKHCGFIVNKGNASASDVIELTEHIKKCVYEKFEVNLEPEFKLLGKFTS